MGGEGGRRGEGEEELGERWAGGVGGKEGTGRGRREEEGGGGVRKSVGGGGEGGRREQGGGGGGEKGDGRGGKIHSSLTCPIVHVGAAFSWFIIIHYTKSSRTQSIVDEEVILAGQIRQTR